MSRLLVGLGLILVIGTSLTGAWFLHYIATHDDAPAVTKPRVLYISGSVEVANRVEVPPAVGSVANVVLPGVVPGDPHYVVAATHTERGVCLAYVGYRP